MIQIKTTTIEFNANLFLAKLDESDVISVDIKTGENVNGNVLYVIVYKTNAK